LGDVEEVALGVDAWHGGEGLVRLEEDFASEDAQGLRQGLESGAIGSLANETDGYGVCASDSFDKRAEVRWTFSGAVRAWILAHMAGVMEVTAEAFA